MAIFDGTLYAFDILHDSITFSAVCVRDIDYRTDVEYIHRIRYYVYEYVSIRAMDPTPPAIGTIGQRATPAATVGLPKKPLSD